MYLSALLPPRCSSRFQRKRHWSSGWWCSHRSRFMAMVLLDKSTDWRRSSSHSASLPQSQLDKKDNSSRSRWDIRFPRPFPHHGWNRPSPRWLSGRRNLIEGVARTRNARTSHLRRCSSLHRGCKRDSHSQTSDHSPSTLQSANDRIPTHHNFLACIRILWR